MKLQRAVRKVSKKVNIEKQNKSRYFFIECGEDNNKYDCENIYEINNIDDDLEIMREDRNKFNNGFRDKYNFGDEYNCYMTDLSWDELFGC